MRTKTVLRYYCEFCSKGMFKKPSMIRHEATCCKNPNRFCGLCDAEPKAFDIPFLANMMQGRDDVHNHEMLDGDIYTTASKDAINWLMGKVDGCPTCTLAVLQQGKIMAFEVFDYKKELSEWHLKIASGPRRQSRLGIEGTPN